MVRLRALLCRPRPRRRGPREEARLDGDDHGIDGRGPHGADLRAWARAAAGDEEERRARQEAATKVQRVLAEIDAARGADAERGKEILRAALGAAKDEVALTKFTPEDVIDRLADQAEAPGGLATLRMWGAADVLEVLFKKWESNQPGALQDAVAIAEWLTRAIALDLSQSRISEFPPIGLLPCSVNLSGCLQLESLGTVLRGVDGSLDLSDCPQLNNLGALEHVGKDLELYDCVALQTLPANLQVGRDLMLQGCTAINNADAVSCEGILDASDCSQLSEVNAKALGSLVVSVLGAPHPDSYQWLVNLSVGTCSDLSLHALSVLQSVEVDAFTQRLSLIECPSLRHVRATAVSGSKVRNPDFKVHGLPTLETIDLSGTLQEVRVISCGRLTTIRGDVQVETLAEVSFCDALSTLDLLSSERVDSLPPSLHLYGLANLKSFATPCPLANVFVGHCEALVELEAPAVRDLIVAGCPNLSKLPVSSSGDLEAHDWGSPGGNLEISNGFLETTLSGIDAEAIHLLDLPQDLKIFACWALHEVHVDIGLAGRPFYASLGIHGCDNLVSIVLENNHATKELTIGEVRLQFLSQLERFEVPDGVRMTNLTVQNCACLVSLPDLELESLELSALSRLASIAGVRAARKLTILDCAELEDLGILVGGSEGEGATRLAIRLEGCPRVADLELRGISDELTIKRCEALSHLPPGLQVVRSITIHSCPQLAYLGEDISSMRIEIRDCPAFATFPSRIRETTHLEVSDCEAFESLPKVQGLSNGHVIIEDCPVFKNVEEGLDAAILKFSRLGALEELPPLGPSLQQLVVRSCPQFRSLPEGLPRLRSLVLSECTILERLPSDFETDFLNVTSCHALTSLPACVFSWGSSGEADNTPVYRIVLGGSGIVENAPEMDRLRALSSTDPRFVFDVSAPRRSEPRGGSTSLGEPAEKFGTLAEAAATVVDAFDAELPFPTPFSPAQIVDAVPAAYAYGVAAFLRMTFQSKEFGIAEMRAGLLERLREALELLVTTAYPNVRESLCIRMADSGDACADKPIWALNQMQQTISLELARGDRKALRHLGHQLMRLEIVHQHVRNFMDTLSFVDDVCVYLCFEIRLREALDLPVSARAMLFPDFVRVPAEKIDEAREEALAITEEDLDAWLHEWDEWQRQDRLEQAATITLEALPRNSIKRISLSWQTLLGTRLKDPVRLLPSRHVWSLEELLKTWVLSGRDLNNTPRSFEDLQENLTRCI